MTDEMPLGATIPFESVKEDEHQVYQTLFEDHPEGDGLTVGPRSILRTVTEREEMSRSDLRFESQPKAINLMMPKSERFWTS